MADDNTATDTTTDWKATLPEELRDDPTIAQVKDVETLARMTVDSQRELGGRIRIPSKDASEDDWSKFWQKFGEIPGVARVPTDPEAGDWSDVLKKMGRPDDPTGYEVEDQAFAKTAHELGLSKKQATKVHELLTKDQSERQVREQQQIEQAVDGLKKKYGQGFERLVGNARTVIGLIDKANGNTALSDALENTELGKHPAVIEAFGAIAKMLDEPTLNKGEGDRHGFRLSPKEALDRAKELERTEAFKKGEQDVVDKIARLYQIAYPD